MGQHTKEKIAMIYCTLDGQVAYPSTSSKIKVTYENPFVKDSGSYTYDIAFPMAVAQNRKVFCNVQRLDVKKTTSTYQECQLYVGNRLVMSGKGTVNSITNDVVKVQIIGGKSRLKYNSNFEKHYIDEIRFPAIELDTGLLNERVVGTFQYYDVNVNLVDGDKKVFWEKSDHHTLTKDSQWVFPDLTKDAYVGQKGVCVLSPVEDETNGIMANRVFVMGNKDRHDRRYLFEKQYAVLLNPAPQPYLMYVLRKVLEHEGYVIKVNELDKEPWNRLVVVSACKTCHIEDALPHWTVYTFIDEVRKLFNASFVFDEISKTVEIRSTNELLSQDVVTYDCEDEFSTEYEDDGLNNLATSNIEYSFDSSANRQWMECVSPSVLKRFASKEYASTVAAIEAARAMTAKERRTTLFIVDGNYFVFADMPKNDDPNSEETEEQFTQVGFFNPIVRNESSDDYQELNISPAAIYKRVSNSSDDVRWNGYVDYARKVMVVVPSVSNEKEAGFESMEVDDDGEYYETIQDAIESGEETASAAEGDNEKMVIAFVGRKVVNVKTGASLTPSSAEDSDKRYRWPVLYTDFRYFREYSGESSGTLSLNRFGFHLSPYGDGGVGGGLGFSDASIDKNNLFSIKFITDDIPDPSKIYVFRSKRYICSKVELNVAEDGVDKQKTGYFYELL